VASTERAMCSRCGSTWTALGAAHCAAEGCHQTFSAVSLFDRHRYVTRDHGGCVAPAEMMDKGKQVAFFRDGMWRGPELSEEQRRKMFGR
jgi:hypothetical protein